ncbi:hypothetical protein [Streptosporangium amethystogenes]|uniref:hypothetical protein n=1 Tax=Streptosporangium amethystogenes TaxID=2002 RepID=UPI0004C8E31F|nr:hypothetical protein [Streptosporangium amethystogenes]
MRRILILLAFIVPLLTLAAPARAGGWAITVMDPVPAKTDPDTTYTLGFWLLQHGTHPYLGDDLGEVALRFTDGKKSLKFVGVELTEPAHYAAAISLPKGTWEVEAIQGWFAPYRIGTLSVPGGLEIAPVPSEFRQSIAGQPPQEHWGAIRPPAVPLGDLVSGTPATPAATPAAAPAGGPAAGMTTVAVVERGSWWRPSYLVAGLLGVTALAALVYRVRRR